MPVVGDGSYEQCVAENEFYESCRGEQYENGSYEECEGTVILGPSAYLIKAFFSVRLWSAG